MSDNSENIFGKRLQQALEIRQMKAIELARKSGVTRGIISSYISGRWKAKQTNVMRLAQALNVSEAWLMGYEVPMERPDKEAFSVSSLEKNLLLDFRRLSPSGQQSVLNFLEFTKNNENQAKK